MLAADLAASETSGALNVERNVIFPIDGRLHAYCIVIDYVGLDLELALQPGRTGQALFGFVAQEASAAIPQWPLFFFAGQRFRQGDLTFGLAVADRAGGVLFGSRRRATLLYLSG